LLFAPLLYLNEIQNYEYCVWERFELLRCLKSDEH
jgi:hypothetical protein